MFILKCFLCCQHKLGMFTMQAASSLSPKSGQLSEKAPETVLSALLTKLVARSIATVHRGSCKAQQGVIFDAENLVKMMCFFAKPKRQPPWVNKDSAEAAAAFGPEDPTWECFFLGRSCMGTRHSQGEKNHNGVDVRVGEAMCSWQSFKAQKWVHQPPLLLIYLPLETTPASTNLSL